MRIAFTHNCRRADSEDDAEFDSPETVAAICAGLAQSDHDVVAVEVTDLAPMAVAERLRAIAPDVVFNTVEGRHGRMREAFYPALFEMLGYPYTGSDAYTMTITLDKWLTKLIVSAHGVRTPRAQMLTAELADSSSTWRAFADFRWPVIVKPNFEGSSKGVSDHSVARDAAELRAIARQGLERFPAGVLVEEYIDGDDLTVPILQSVGGPERCGVLSAVSYYVEPSARSRYNLYDYRLKNRESDRVRACCPADISAALMDQLQRDTRTAVRALGIRDLGRADFRLSKDGCLYFLEMNALPSLEAGSSLFEAAAREGLSYAQTLARIVEHTAARARTAQSAGVCARTPSSADQ